MIKMLTSACLLFVAVSAHAQMKSKYTLSGGTLDFNAPIVQDKTSLTNLAPAGQLVYENTTSSFYGLAPNGVWVSFGSATGSNSQVTVEGSVGNGSTGVRVKYYSNVVQNATSDILYTSDAINGDTFTILASGIYSISYSASANANDNFGISKNVSATVPVTDASIAAGNVLARCSIPAGNVSCNASWTGFLSTNDVIRSHQEGSTAGTSRLHTFTITRMN